MKKILWIYCIRKTWECRGNSIDQKRKYKGELILTLQWCLTSSHQSPGWSQSFARYATQALIHDMMPTNALTITLMKNGIVHSLCSNSCNAISRVHVISIEAIFQLCSQYPSASSAFMRKRLMSKILTRPRDATKNQSDKVLLVVKQRHDTCRSTFAEMQQQHSLDRSRPSSALCVMFFTYRALCSLFLASHLPSLTYFPLESTHIRKRLFSAFNVWKISSLICTLRTRIVV